jgi:Ca2+-binding EF-hand superfamily protein
MLIAALFFAASDAQARSENAGQAAAERFALMDTNKDGKVSPAAFFAAYPNMRETAFAVIDTDGDGFISLDEWLAFFNSHSRGDSQAHSHDKEEPCQVCEEHSGSNRVPALLMPPARP